MRGWLSLFTNDTDPTAYKSGLFLASAEMDVITKVRPSMAKQWPRVNFTILAPQAYADEFRAEPEVLWLEQVRSTPLHTLRSLRSRKFDLCVVLLPGRPTFRKLKLSALFLNARRVIIYNENGDSIGMDRAHWKSLGAHLMNRATGPQPYTFFVPFGFSYLALRTFWLTLRAKFNAHKA
jgi:hypothetical protein